jgi:hypothetical protein
MADSSEGVGLSMMLNRAGERVQRQRRRSMGVRDTSKDEIGKVQDMVISFCE